MRQTSAVGLDSLEPRSASTVEPMDVVWTKPSKDAAGSMPLGNGQVGLNLWVEENGDLRFYISRTDSYSEISRLLKVGAVRITISPNPFKASAAFKQQLILHDGVCVIEAGQGAGKLTLRVFVDSENPIVYCTGKSGKPVHVKVTVDSWRTERIVIPTGTEQNSAWSLHHAPFELSESADVFPKGIGNAVAWYHRNEESVAFKSTMKLQSLESVADQVKDPIIHRTFGGWITASGFKPVEGHALSCEAPVKQFAISIATPCMQATHAQDWMNEAEKLANTADADKAGITTARWWRSFWDRSWVVVKGDNGYTVPRSSHPLRVGFDSNGENKFQGEIGRASIRFKALTPKEIQAMMTGNSQAIPLSEGWLLTGSRTEADTHDFKSTDLKNGLTLEAMIRPDTLTPGRIVDNLTAGGSDGFLLDTHPGNTVRFIVGNAILSAPAGILKIGQWQHVAATVDGVNGATRIYLNGHEVASTPGLDMTHSPVTRAYALQRYVQACGAKGPFPVKFNGSIFTVEPAVMGMPFNPDWRNWGDCHWWQNVRIGYHPMLASGDVEMMEPLFELYERVRPICEARSKLYHGVTGCYFPETMTMWGTYSNGDYGWDRSGLRQDEVQSPWWQYAWNQGLELVAIMLDRWEYTQDEAFLTKRVLPMAVSVLNYFDTRFKRDANGKIVLDPTQAVETFWHEVTNDMPSVAGLNDILIRLCALPQRMTTSSQCRFFKNMKSACPSVPTEDTEVRGKTIHRLAVAQKYSAIRSNCENPELYAVWPFRLYGIGKPGLELARAAYTTRANQLDVGWGYDGNCAALLGMADEAARIMMVKAANSNPAYRWPASWGPNFDWVPDQDHGGNLLLTTQLMLLQSDVDTIRLLPAWPKKWDVSFKLKASLNTTVECVYKKGKVVSLKVTPESRRKDIVMPT